MAELIVREVDPAILAKLKGRAEKRRRSVEEEHRAILRDVLLASDQEPSAVTFEQYPRAMPNVGADADFARIEGSIRDANLGD